MNIVHREYEGRGEFVVEQAGEQVAELTYTHGDHGMVTADHTWVDDSLRGRGVAAELVAALVAWARDQGVHIVPACSYVARAFDANPLYAELRAP